MAIELTQSTQFKIRSLSIISKVGNFDVSGLFDELNIFDSILMPCMSGNIIIRDAIGLSNKLLFDGSEYLSFDISKGDEDSVTNLNKTFRIYKQTDRKQINQSSEMYILHFVAEELIYSEQQNINQAYSGNHHQIAEKILTDYLKVLPRSGKIGIIEPSKGIHSSVIPGLSPFEAMNWLAQRAINSEGLPNYVFYQNRMGYNFVSLSTLLSQNQLFDVNFQPKNMGPSLADEFIGARDVKILSQYDLAENIRSGVYSGKFIGFDPLTRKLNVSYINLSDVYLKGKHGNKNPNLSTAKNREGLDASQMYDSKISLYPFASTRNNSKWIKTNDPTTGTIIDDTHNYVIQRKAILGNLMQTRIQMTLPGNFAISSGFNLFLKMPNRSVEEGAYDDTLYGKYLIIGTRHMIKYDKHETIVEVATDSTNRQLIMSDTQSSRTAGAQ